ncbi:MAG TPA: helix-turn-helix domain-containing protein [Solirubrobacterales bacterium]|nr:helix-turn-helix domain-containing protein [Solirubrobacterales bacterium]
MSPRATSPTRNRSFTTVHVPSGDNVGVEKGVGAALRDARSRRDLELEEVEAAIKIRVRLLRAIEDEDWDLLPGGAYTRGFIRSYAAFLGLDGERLVDEYRRSAEAESSERAPRRTEPVTIGAPGRDRRRPSGKLAMVLVALAVVGLLIAIGLAGSDDPEPPPQRLSAQPREPSPGAGQRPAAAAAAGVSLSLEAAAEVWVCLLDGEEEVLVDGEILAPGEKAGPFRGESFAVAFGNGQVEISIDGERRPTPASSGPIGYEVDAGGRLSPLAEGERPECT